MSEWDSGHFSAYLDAAMSNADIKNDAELARLSGVNQTQIGNWRRGTARPSMRLLRNVADALDVPAQSLYVLAGWLDADQEKTQELTPLPREIRELIALYESTTNEAQRRYFLQQLEFARRGLQASTPPDAEQPKKPDRRRAS